MSWSGNNMSLRGAIATKHPQLSEIARQRLAHLQRIRSLNDIDKGLIYGIQSIRRNHHWCGHKKLTVKVSS